MSCHAHTKKKTYTRRLDPPTGDAVMHCHQTPAWPLYWYETKQTKANIIVVWERHYRDLVTSPNRQPRSRDWRDEEGEEVWVDGPANILNQRWSSTPIQMLWDLL